MKKFIIFSIIILAALSSCEKDEGLDVPTMSKHIGYEVSLKDGFRQGKTKSGLDAASELSVCIDEVNGKLREKSLFLHTETEGWKNDTLKTKGSILSSLSGLGISAWLYKDNYEAGKPYFENDEHSFAGNTVTTGRYWPQKDEGYSLRFYAYAPLGIVELPPTSGWTDGVPSFNYTVPDNISEQGDLLVASSNVGSSAFGNTIQMDFGHALTAVQFMIDDELTDFTINSITISGVKKSGTYTYAYSENGDGNSGTQTHDNGRWTGQEGDGEFILDFGVTGYPCTGEAILNNDESGNVLFMMPQDLGAGAKITMIGTDTYNGANTTVTLSAVIGGDGKKWEKGTKVVYKISANSIKVEYVFEVEDVTSTADIAYKATAGVDVETKIKSEDIVPYYGQLDRKYRVESYKKVYSLGNAEPNIVGLKWKLDYEGSSDWIDWISTCEFTNEYNGTYNGTYNVVANTPNGVSHSNLAEKSIKGIQEAYDLSEGRETANCYIIDAPGYYKLPLIYGNARGNDGNENIGSYSTTKEDRTVTAGLNNGSEVTVDVKVLKKFLNYKGQPITSYKIVDDLNNYSESISGAELVWQDEPCLVTELEVIDGFLHFRVRKDCICEGNAVISIKDSKGTIVWSWHIWVTDNAPENNAVDIFNRRVIQGPDASPSYSTFANFISEKFQIMPSFIGFCDAEVKTYNERTGRIVFKQLDEDGNERGEPVELSVFQEGKEVASYDNTLFYQYGRKDPRPSAYAKPETPGATKDKEYYLTNRRQYWNGYDGTGKVGFIQKSDFVSTSQTTSIEYAIQNPGLQMPNWTNEYTANKEYKGVGDWNIIRIGHWYNEPGEENYFNLWNTNSNILPMFTYKGMGFGYGDIASSLSSLDDLINIGVTKTIYDPSPVGYEMPRIDAFMGFTYDGINADDKSSWMYKNINTHNTFNPSGGYRFFTTPMDGPDNVDNNAGLGFFINALGYRNNSAGAINGYKSYGAALTSSPICVEGTTYNYDDETVSYDGFFSLKVAKLYYLHNDEFVSPLVYTMSWSDLSIAFPVMPVKTGSNPIPDSKKVYDSNSIPESY